MYAEMERYYGRSLYECYAKPSYAKIAAYERIKREMLSCDGWGLTVLSYNTCFFTCAYFRENPEIGVVEVVKHYPTRVVVADA